MVAAIQTAQERQLNTRRRSSVACQLEAALRGKDVGQKETVQLIVKVDRQRIVRDKRTRIARELHDTFLQRLLSAAKAGYVPGGAKANEAFAGCMVQYVRNIPDDVRALLFDPQTAGGLLIAMLEEEATKLCSALASENGTCFAVVGEVFASTSPSIVIA